jgi:uncharacterized protein YegL
MSNSVNTLIQAAASAGILSSASLDAITGDLGEVVIAGAAGVDLETIQASDVTLVTILIDASSSIAGAGLEGAIVAGQRDLVDAFAGSRERESILMALWIFNDQLDVVHAYVPVADATRLDPKTYRPGGGTRLYDTWCDALAANVAYAQLLRDGGTPCRSVIVVITDGEDCGSRKTPGDCARLSRDLLASEQFVLAFVGVGKSVDFRAIAKKMGVPDGSVAVQSQATPAALRQVFRMVSQSAIRASRATVGPGAAQGFFAP